MPSPTLTVSAINLLIKDNLETDPSLQGVSVQGEITNLKFYQAGQQVYFNLTDGESQLNCVIYSSFFQNVGFKLQNGIQVVVNGKVRLFHKKGSISFQVIYMQPAGAGALAQSFEALKEKLMKEGLFDAARKKPIPLYPEKVGLITAWDSAAMNDYVTISRKLTPHMKIGVLPATMQGLTSPASVTSALMLAEATDLDVVIILRGGGSSEDLASFNDEQLVRQIASCKVPTVTAIGHEIDYTLSDFVADLRVPTPTAAAQRIAEPFLTFIKNTRYVLDYQSESLFRDWQNLSDQAQELFAESNRITQDRLGQAKSSADQLIHRLTLADPLYKLRQGYSINRLKSSGKIVKSTTQIEVGSVVVSQLNDGAFESTVSQIL